MHSSSPSSAGRGTASPTDRGHGSRQRRATRRWIASDGRRSAQTYRRKPTGAWPHWMAGTIRPTRWSATICFVSCSPAATRRCRARPEWPSRCGLSVGSRLPRSPGCSSCRRPRSLSGWFVRSGGSPSWRCRTGYRPTTSCPSDCLLCSARSISCLRKATTRRVARHMCVLSCATRPSGSPGFLPT